MTNQMKARVEVSQGPEGALLDFVKEKTGVVTPMDKLKNYYKGIIAFVGALLIILQQATPLFDFLGPDAQSWFTGIVSTVTAIGVFLKANEKYVDMLP